MLSNIIQEFRIPPLHQPPIAEFCPQDKIVQALSVRDANSSCDHAAFGRADTRPRCLMLLFAAWWFHEVSWRYATQITCTKTWRFWQSSNEQVSSLSEEQLNTAALLRGRGTPLNKQFLGFLVSSLLDFLVSSFLGFLVPWRLGFFVSKFLGLWVSKFQRFSIIPFHVCW